MSFHAKITASTKDDSAATSEAQIAAAKALWAEKKQDLVSKLVQLRIKQQDLKENPSLEEIDFRKILGHKFKRYNLHVAWILDKYA